MELEERGAEKSQLYQVMSYRVKKLAAWWKKYIFHTARRTIKSVITLTPTPGPGTVESLLSALGSTGGFEEQCIILHWILELCAIGSALVDGGLLDCNGLQ